MRRSAAEACSNEWVFSLDADERCTPALREEIKALLAAEPAHDAYQVPRRNYMMGRWIKGSGWYPNYRGLQLFRKGRVRYLPDIVHEGYELTGDRGMGKLQNDVWHFSYQNLEELVHKMNVFSSLGAQRMAGQRVSMGSALGHAVWAFLKHYIFKAGFQVAATQRIRHRHFAQAKHVSIEPADFGFRALGGRHLRVMVTDDHRVTVPPHLSTRATDIGRSRCSPWRAPGA